jgi:glycerate kinase
VIEMAAASGLELIPPAQRDPLMTTTRGTGELIRAALDAGCSRVLLGIGGSATCDGGTGMAQALGCGFLDARGHVIRDTMTGGRLRDINQIDPSAIDARLRETRIVVACDVTNPLTGPDGAAAVYGPQKGATPEAVAQLDAGLAHLATLLGHDPAMPGAGAAGGLGYGLVALLGARLERGIDLVLDACRFDRRVRGADLCLTGEGRLDGQSLAGKTVIGVARAAARHGVPTVALVGSTSDDADRTLEAGLRAYRVIGEGMAAEDSIRRGPELLARAAAETVRQFRPV